MGFRLAPGRFIRSGRGAGLPRWRFAPLTSWDTPFNLRLDRAQCDYKLTSVNGTFTAEVRVGGHTGKASGEAQSRTIVLALARALGLEKA